MGKLKRIKSILGWASFVLLIVTQWEVRSWALFADAMLITYCTWWALDHFFTPRWWDIPVLAGGLLNTIVVIANGGRMPALSSALVTIKEPYRWWQPMTDTTRLNFLGDVYLGFSVGDLIIFGTGLVIVVQGIINFTHRRDSVNAANAGASGE